MFKLVAFALAALAAFSMVSGAAIFPRQNPPSGWNSDVLESYDDYHTRYLAIGCQNQPNTQFFDDCCHPLKKGETLENNRLPCCSPGANPSSTPSEPPSNTLVLISEPSSSPAPESTSVPDSGDDCEDDEDDDDEISDDDDQDEDCENDDTPSTSPVYVPSSTPPSVPTPYNSDPTPTPTPEPSPSSSTDEPTSSPTPDQNTSSGSETHTGGDLTWFTQNGVAGACGTVHQDSDFIAALDSRAYRDTGSQSSYCGKKIRVTWQGKSVDVVVADACPTCSNPSSVDLSLAAFQALAPLDTGLLSDATWTLL